jgi:hypothetical protein
MAGVVLPGVNNLGKAGDKLFHGRVSTLNSAFKGQPRPRQQPSPSKVICDSPGFAGFRLDCRKLMMQARGIVGRASRTAPA